MLKNLAGIVISNPLVFYPAGVIGERNAVSVQGFRELGVMLRTVAAVLRK